MPTYIDEAGDTGWKDGAKPYFRCAAVWLPTREVVDECGRSIQEARTKLGVAADYEFKFSTTSHFPEARSAFFEAVRRHEFYFVVMAYDKSAMQHNSFSKLAFHWGCTVSLAVQLRRLYVLAESQLAETHGKPKPLNEQVIVDDNKDQEWLAMVKGSFRGLKSSLLPGKGYVGKVRFRNSRPEDMIQLVDMIVGAAGSHIDRTDSHWFNLIETRCVKLDCEPK